MDRPNTLEEAIQFFADYENCRKFMVAIRWQDGKVRCPYCGADKITYLEKARVYRCYSDHPKQKFSLKVGTIFEDSPVPLDKWLAALWMLVNCKNGISSYEVARDLGVTQKSAWFMLQRLRLALPKKSMLKLGGSGHEVEVDETFIGGAARFMNPTRRRRLVTGSGVAGKTPVIGILDRNTKQVRATVIEGRRRRHVQPEVIANVQPGTNVYTDNLASYDELPEWGFEHKVVDHAIRYVNGRVHTNGLENFWSLLKRQLKGTYISVEPFHLFRYVDEQAWRYNNRATKDNPMTDADRFDLALSQIAGKRLTFAGVTGKVGSSEADF